MVSSLRRAAGLLALLLATFSPPLSASEPVTGGDAMGTLQPTASSFESRKQALATARAFEQAAARAKKPARAASLLEAAYTIRVFIGPKKHALKDIQDLERLYAGDWAIGGGARAADAFWRRREMIQAQVGSRSQAVALRQHAVRYLARYGDIGGIDRTIVAKFVIAEYDWLRSCPRQGVLSLCVTWQQDGRSSAAVRDRLVELITPRIDEALRAKLREQLMPMVRERLGKRQRNWPRTMYPQLNTVQKQTARRAANRVGSVYITKRALEQAVEREVELALPEARIQALARAGVRTKPTKYPPRCHDLDGLPAERLVVHRRNKSRMTAARKRLEELRHFIRKAHDSDLDDLPPARQAEVDEALDKVEIYSFDADFENLLRTPVPSRLQFHYEEWKKDSGLPSWEREYLDQIKAAQISQKRFRTYREYVLKKAAKLHEGYARVIAAKRHPGAGLLATSRTAMLWLSWAVKLRGAAISSNTKKLEHARVFCDTLTDQAKPVTEQALAALTYCVDRATNYQYFTPAARWCEQRLSSLEPRKFPELREFVGPFVDGP